MRIEDTRTISSPAGIVWLLLTDPAHQRKWLPILIEANMKGTQGTWTLRQRGRRVSYRCEITAQEPERRYGFALSAGLLPDDWTIRCSHELTPGKNETLLRTTYRLQAESFSFKYLVAWPVLKIAGSTLVHRWLSRLERLAEEAAYVK